MATKTISITEEAYERLRSRKYERESFSDVIYRMTKRKKLSDFYGMLGEKAAKMEEAITESRKQTKKLHEDRMRNLLKEMKR